ncbi:MAG: type II toxin-antitoxin system death-on-curing family toxin [Burkholderiales bacterium]
MSKRRKEPRWLSRLVIDAVHTDQLREHGGLPGVRDETALESALARPQQRWHYGQGGDLSTVAAAYAFGLVKNHPYRDGNKRNGFLAMVTFLGLNGFEFEAPEAEIVTRIVTLAAGQLTEEQLAEWIRSRIVRVIESADR